MTAFFLVLHVAAAPLDWNHVDSDGFLNKT